MQFQITNIYYTKESPRNKEYDKYPYFKHVVKPQDDIVGYYALKQDFKYVVLRKVYHRLVKNAGAKESIQKWTIMSQLDGH